jgi:hypothetical protein
MSSRTKIVNISKLAADPLLGSVLVRLMMVINDFSIANDAVGFWRADETPKRQSRRDEAVRYFVGLQVAHVYEGMLDIIAEIEKTPALRVAVERCDQPTRAEFAELVAYRATPEFQSIMGRIRNNLAFHYTPGLAQRTLVALASQHPDTMAPISMGNDALDWYFEPGALVRDRVGVREVFQIPAGANIRLETDALLTRLHAISDTFGRFAGNFIWQLASS